MKICQGIVELIDRLLFWISGFCHTARRFYVQKIFKITVGLDDAGNKAFLEEQRRIVEQIEQERRDREVALKMQSELDILER